MRSTVGAVIVLLLAVAVDPARLFETVPITAPPSEENRAAQAGPSPARVTTQSVPAAYFEDPLLFLSTAPVDSLLPLPGIGPVLAERLASYRSGKSLFTQWEDLLAVNGIGPKKLERLRRLAAQK